MPQFLFAGIDEGFAGKTDLGKSVLIAGNVYTLLFAVFIEYNYYTC
jgi:hypothetical protein